MSLKIRLSPSPARRQWRSIRRRRRFFFPPLPSFQLLPTIRRRSQRKRSQREHSVSWLLANNPNTNSEDGECVCADLQWQPLHLTSKTLRRNANDDLATNETGN